MFLVEDDPVAFATFWHSSGKTTRRQRTQTTATQIFGRYPVAIHIKPPGREIAGLVQHVGVAAFALNDDDGIGIGETFQVYPHGTPASKANLSPFVEVQP